MAKLKKSDKEQLWAQAQRRGRLSDEAIRTAREMGLSPRSLIKNIPSPKQPWTAPVEDWVRDIYEKRSGGRARRGPKSDGSAPPQAEGEP